MTQTTLNSNLAQKIQGVTLVLVLSSTSITPSESPLNYFSQSLTLDSILTTSASSKSAHLIGETKSWEEMRLLHIKLLRGKYKNILTSSEEFSRNKNHEIILEG